MSKKPISSCWLQVFVFEFLIAGGTFAQVNVLNVNYDTQQTGANLQETTLAPTTNWNAFGKVGTFPVDGQVYAQPLYVSGVAIGGNNYNVLYLATMHNSIFAFNADTPQSATPLWQVNLGPPVQSGLFNFTDILPEIGILGTPAIDKTQQVLYVVTDTLPAGAFSTPVFSLHALSLVDGHEMFGGPVQVAPSVQGTGAGSSNGSIVFDGFAQLQRPGLILANGTLYAAFGSHADAGNYQGWIVAYDASTLQQSAVFNSAPNGRQGAFWHSGRAPVIDPNGDVYAVTGNGDFDGSVNFSESVLRLSGSKLSVLDWYTPSEWSSLNSQDWDLGSTGAILIPDTNLLLVGGKSGLLYLVQDDAMGHEGPDTTSTVEGVQVNGWGMFNMALWNNAPGGPTVYEFEPFGAVKAFQILKGQINSTILSQFTPQNTTTYVGISISANGANNGIVWLLTGNNNVVGPEATLHALDASDLSRELWNSDLNPSRDQPGQFVKFAPPTVANGRVFVPTLSDAVAIYGPLAATTSVNPAISSVVNSASFLTGAVSPGELITIFGANLGPVVGEQGMVQGNAVSDVVENTQVLIGGVTCPILFASSTQVNTVVPFDITGTSTTIEVSYQGQQTASTTVSVDPASPAVFSVNGTGGGQGAILNQDGSVNSSTNPASRGSVVSIFATGAGITTPASVDGQITSAPYPIVPGVTVTIDGKPATIEYAGAAPGLIAGALQINAVVPENAGQETYDQVVVTVGVTASPTAVTMSVH